MNVLTEKDLQIIVKFAQNRKWDKLIAKKVGNRFESILTHHLKTQNILSKTIEMIGNDMNFSDEEKKVTILIALLHDAGKENPKWQEKIFTGSKGFVSHVGRKETETILQEIIEKLGWKIKEELILDAINAIEQHMEGERRNPSSTLDSILSTKSSNKKKWVSISHLVSFADRLASIIELEDCLSIIKGLGLARLTDLLEITYHKVNQIRGIATTLLHKAAETTFIKKKWQSILYFPNGTVYLGKKGDTENFNMKEFSNELGRELNNFMETYNENALEAVVGNPTASMVNLPKLFDWNEVEDYFKVAQKRTKVKAVSAVDDTKQTIPYLTYLEIKNMIDKEAAREFIESDKIFKKKYPNFKVKINKEHRLFELTKSEFAEINPEIVLFSFFKTIFKTLATEEMVTTAQIEFDKIFGEGIFKELQSMANLKPARDRVIAIDNYWSLPINRFEGNSNELIKTLTAVERQRILRETLTRICTIARNKNPPVKTNFYKEIIFKIAENDLIYPINVNLNAIKSISQSYLEYWIDSKHSQQSAKSSFYICPSCNNKFQEENLIAAEITGFKEQFTNRAIGGSKTQKGISICNLCELEYLLRYLTIKGKITHLIILYPEICVNFRQGTNLIKQIMELERGISKLKSDKIKGNSFMEFSFRNQVLEPKLGEYSTILKSLKNQNIENFLEFFSYQKTSKTVTKDLINAVIDTIDGFCEIPKSFPELNSFEEALNLTQKLLPFVDRKEIQVILEGKIPNESENYAFHYVTPNIVIWTLKQGIVKKKKGKDEESKVNIALKKLLIATMVSIATGYSTAIIDTNDQIPPSPMGRVFIPINSHIRNIFNNNSWIPNIEIETIFEKISAAIILAKRAAYPIRSAVYNVLKEPLKGKLLIRIETKQNSLWKEDFDNIELIYGEKNNLKINIGNDRKKFDSTNYDDEINKIIDKFVLYMNEYTPNKRGSGLTTLLGPSLKIINKLKSDSTIILKSLLGFGLRTHEMSSDYLSSETIELLEDAVITFYEFMKIVPIKSKKIIFDSIYYGLVYELKKKSVLDRSKYMTALRNDFTRYLKENYQSIEDFNKKAGTSYNDFSKALPPTNNNLKKMKQAERDIATDFLKKRPKSELTEEKDSDKE